MVKRLHRNTLLRYQKIKELYLLYKTEDIPDSVVFRKYIRPVYPISKSTFNTVLSTPIEKLLSEISNHATQECK